MSDSGRPRRLLEVAAFVGVFGLLAAALAAYDAVRTALLWNPLDFQGFPLRGTR